MAEAGGARKRREANGAGADGHSPVKKLKLEDDEPPEANPNTLEAVRHKNKEMALDLLEKNRRIAFLAHKCESLFRQCAVSQRAFRCIQRQWLQLVDDVASAGAAVTVENMDAWRDVVGKTDSLGVLRLPAEAVTVALPDWFVAISRGDKDADLKESGDDDDDEGGDHGTELETKSEMLNEKEKQLREALEGERQRVSELLQSIFAAVANGATRQLEFKELVGQKRTATAQVLELKDDLDAMKRKLTDMQSDLEAKEVERHRACRAYDRLKDFVERQGTATAVESANGVKPENGNAPGGGGGGEGQDGKAPPRAGAKRVTLVDPEANKPSADREAVQRLQNDIGILVQKLKEERAKVEVMRSELTHLRAFETAAKQEDARTKQEFDATVTRLREEKSQLDEQLAAARAQDADHRAQVEAKWKAHLDKIKDDAAKTKAKLNDLMFKNTALREKLTSLSVYRDQLIDLKAEHESLKREADALRQQLEREKSRAERVEQVAESKQNVELREKLAVVEEERDALRERVTALTSSLEKPGDVNLADALRRESDAVKKWEQLQAEVSELRAAAETARAELEMANANQDAFKDENDALVAEIEALGKELEATRYSKKKMVKQLEEKRQSAQKLKSELAKEADARSHATEELATVRLQVGSLKYVHSQQKAALEAAKELQKTTEHELAELKRALETVQSERDALGAEKVKAERDAEVAQQMYKAEAVHKQRQVLQDKSRPCDKCDAYRKKEAEYEKRLAALRAAAGTLSSETGGSGGSGGGGLSELERFELQDLRKQLTCSVCQDRHKNVIISKCSHLFCKECVDSNLRSRNRKCPTCKKMFGQDDVKSVWFT